MNSNGRFLFKGVPRIGGRSSVPYHCILILREGAAKRISAWADAEQAADGGVGFAKKYFPGQTVEVVVVHSMTREAVITRLIT